MGRTILQVPRELHGARRKKLCYDATRTGTRSKPAKRERYSTVGQSCAQRRRVRGEKQRQRQRRKRGGDAEEEEGRQEEEERERRGGGG
eukprot:1594817-Rhodomonas_salina.1